MPRISNLLLLLLLLVSIAICKLSAQPNVCFVGQTSSGCPTSGTPTAQSYIAGTTTMLATLAGISNPLPKPPIEVYAHIPPALTTMQNSEVGCVPSTTCIFTTAASGTASKGLNAYTLHAIGSAAAKGVGVIGVWWGADPIQFIQANTYAGSCTNAQPSWRTVQLAQNLAWAKYVTGTLGLKFRIEFQALPSSFTACGVTPGSVTQSQYNSSVNPMAAAAIAYLAANSVTVDEVIFANEPQGYNQIATSNASPFTAAQFTALISSGCAAIHAASGGSGVKCGGGYAAGDSTYITNYISNATADDTVYGGETYCGKTSSACAALIETVAGFCPSAIAAGMICDNNEGNPPTYVQSTAPNGGEQYATSGYGCASPNMQTFGVSAAWFYGMFRYLSASRFSSAVWFGSQAAAQIDPVLTDTCYSSTGATAYAMQHTTVATPTATAFQQSAAWGNAGLSGQARVRGHARIR